MKINLLATILLPFGIHAQNFQGPYSPAIAENTSCPYSYSSSIDYMPESNAFTSNDVYASASHCDCCDANTRCFETKGFGFSIPLTATIDGILVEVEKKATGGSMVQDNGVKLLKAGVTAGLSQATTSNWPASDTYFSYGGATDLWGTTWMPEDINDPGFGLALASISYTCFGTGNPVISYIDHVSITVYFKDVATSAAPVSNSNTNHFQLAPNPAKAGIIHLSLPTNEEQWHISFADITGNTTLEKTITVQKTLEVTLSPGIYTVTIKGYLINYVQKLMVM